MVSATPRLRKSYFVLSLTGHFTELQDSAGPSDPGGPASGLIQEYPPTIRVGAFTIFDQIISKFLLTSNSCLPPSFPF